MAQGSPAIGSFEGTGSAYELILGFTPSYIRLVNTEDRDATWEWFSDMPAASAVKTSTAVATLASNGVTALDGEDGAGVTLGTDISISGKTIHYFAVR